MGASRSSCSRQVRAMRQRLALPQVTRSLPTFPQMMSRMGSPRCCSPDPQDLEMGPYLEIRSLQKIKLR